VGSHIDQDHEHQLRRCRTRATRLAADGPRPSPSSERAKHDHASSPRSLCWHDQLPEGQHDHFPGTMRSTRNPNGDPPNPGQDGTQLSTGPRTSRGRRHVLRPGFSGPDPGRPPDVLHWPLTKAAWTKEKCRRPTLTTSSHAQSDTSAEAEHNAPATNAIRHIEITKKAITKEMGRHKTTLCNTSQAFFRPRPPEKPDGCDRTLGWLCGRVFPAVPWRTPTQNGINFSRAKMQP